MSLFGLFGASFKAASSDLMEAADLLPPVTTPSGSYRCSAEECGQLVEPTDTWHCPLCKRAMRYGFDYRPCPKCGQRAFWVRHGVVENCHCRCSLTEEEHRRDEERWSQRVRREEREHNKTAELKEARRLQSEGLILSRGCYEGKDKKCSVKLSAPIRPYCRFCPKFGPATHFKPQLREEREED